MTDGNDTSTSDGDDLPEIATTGTGATGITGVAGNTDDIGGARTGAASESGPAVGGEVESDAGADSGELLVPADRTAPSGLRKRLIGLLALLLGVLGLLASPVLAFVVVRTGFGAGSAAEDLLDPVANALDRIETRIDQADDTVDPEGVPPELMGELRARTEGLLDVAGSGRDLMAPVTDHPIYQLLPADLGPLQGSLEEFAAGATTIEEIVGSTADGRALSPANAEVVADELNTLQAGVAGANEASDGANRSLRRWIRLGSFLALLATLWFGWAQFCLLRRGARALGGREI